MVDTFVPNDVYVVGGNQEFGVNGGLGGDSDGVAPNVVICTGANACGKVGHVFRHVWIAPETLFCAERIPEAGESTVVPERPIFFTDVLPDRPHPVYGTGN